MKTGLKFALLASLAVAPMAAIAQQGPPPGGMPDGAGAPSVGMSDDMGGAPGGMPSMGSIADTKYQAAIAVTDGVSQAGTPAATIKGGTRGDTFAKGVTITATADAINGVLVKGGRSTFTLKDSKISLSGPGTNDFVGTGAGAMVVGGAMVLDHVNITTNARVSSASVAAEGAVLRVYNSTLTANGGPLPEGYVPRIGPGMLEPPAPLGIVGTARAHLSMSNSRTYFYNSTITADGWGALSTDATGGDLYLEANDSTIIVRKNAYATYADFGAKVVFNRTRIDTGGVIGFIAGEASIALNDVTAKAGTHGVIIHSVMGNPSEIGHLRIKGGKIETKGAVIQVKSANGDVSIDNAQLSSAIGLLVESKVNDDPNATKTNGKKVTGTSVTINKSTLAGDIVNTDTDRMLSVRLADTQLTGAINNASIALSGNSKWTATKNSSVSFSAPVDYARIDAPTGVTVSVKAGAGGPATGTTKLAGGGLLVVTTN